MRPLLRIVPAAVRATLDEIIKAGAGQREAAVFWLGPSDTLAAQTIVVPAGRGVELHPLSIRISEEWMNALGELCDSSAQVVLGGVHSHPRQAFYSQIDGDGFFHAPDFVSVVVPNYGKTDLTSAEDDWAVYVGSAWGKWKRSHWATAVLLDDGLPFRVKTLRLGK